MEKFVLENGVRVLVEPVSYVRSAAIGLWCSTGSRHEHDNEAGITHLIEHMLFKGTPSRSAQQIAEEIEGKGGSLNAFTDKENTCYYCRVLMEEVGTGIEVLSDMMRNSLIDPEELQKEQGVVLEEIKRSLDEPGDHVHDLHIEGNWGNHPLGKPIIGTPESVSSFKSEDLKNYMKRRYVGGHVVLSISGNVDPQKVYGWANDHLGSIEKGSEAVQADRPKANGGSNYVEEDVEQVHFCIGGDGCSLYDADLYVLAVLDGALGSGMSSRLFQEIREKRGLAYSVGSYPLSYTAGGAFTVYGGTSPSTWEQVKELVMVELAKVRMNGLTEKEIEASKRNLAGHMVLSLEGMSARMMRQSRNEINHGKDIPVEDVLKRVNAVQNSQIVELAARIFDESKLRTTVIGPVAG